MDIQVSPEETQVMETGGVAYDGSNQVFYENFYIQLVSIVYYECDVSARMMNYLVIQCYTNNVQLWDMLVGGIQTSLDRLVMSVHRLYLVENADMTVVKDIDDKVTQFRNQCLHQMRFYIDRRRQWLQQVQGESNE